MHVAAWFRMRHWLVYMYKACGHIRDLCTHMVEQTVIKKNRTKKIKCININFYGGFIYLLISIKKKLNRDKN